MKDAKGHGSDARSGPAHQSGVVDAAQRAANAISPDFAKGEIAGAGKNDMSPYTARMALQATDSMNKDYHTLSSSQTGALADYAKQFGYRKSASSPGSTARAFHGYLHKQLYK